MSRPNLSKSPVRSTFQARRFCRAAGFAAAAVVVGLTTSAGIASAQVAANQSGRALDANPLVGSGGSNVGVQSFNRFSGLRNQGIYGGYGTFGNNIITGNVTGGFAFRDAVAYRDTSAFRGSVAGGGIDRFSRDASGFAGSGVINNAGTVQGFYGDAFTVRAPVGTVQVAGSGDHVPPSTNQRLSQFDRYLNV
ncbi:MAG: hypothetical protein AAGK78_14765, partial [Planctomycetota bacterium]